MGSKRFCFYLAVAIFLAARPAIAGAHDKRTDADLARAKRHFARAEALERGGDWTGALEALQQTAAITMTPGIRYHIAYCQERLGRLVEASRGYAIAQREARAAKGGATKSVLPLAEERFNDVAARVPHVTLRVRPEPARDKVKVLVDLREATVLPSGTFEIDPGDHMVEVAAAGFAPVRLPMKMAEKELREVEVTLLPVVQATHAVPAAPTPAALRHVAAEPGEGSVRVGAIVATSAATVLAGLGIGAYALAGGSQGDGRIACAAQTGSCDELKGSVRAYDAVALGAWIGAAALGITATVLWLRPRPRSAQGSAHVSIGPAHLAVGLAF
jgi:hypothetical protein